MAEFKVTINNPRTGKSYKRDLSGNEAEALVGLGIGDVISGDKLGFSGYEFQVMGGSDHVGLPMRRGVQGERKRVLTYEGVGFKGKNRQGERQEGLRVRKTVAGERIHGRISQVNLKVTKEGSGDVFEKPAEDEQQTEQQPSAQSSS